MKIILNRPEIKDHFAIIIPDTDSSIIELYFHHNKIGECLSYQILVSQEMYNANKEYFDNIASKIPLFKEDDIDRKDYYIPKEFEYSSINQLKTTNNKVNVSTYKYILPMSITKNMLEYLSTIK